MKNKCGKYKLGEVVRIWDKGGLYTTYSSAIKYFNVPNLIKDVYHLTVDVPTDYDEYNWIIVNKAIHYYVIYNDNKEIVESDIVYCVENHRGERLLTSSTYFIKRPNVKTKRTKHLDEKNEFFVPICLSR